MATTQKFTRSMIEAAAREKEWDYRIDSDGEYVIDLGYYEKGRCGIVEYIGTAGQANEILYARCSLIRAVPKAIWGRALLACNEWQKIRHFPAAYLVTREEDGKGYLMTQHGVDLEKGIHQEFVTFFLLQAMGQGLAFSRWINDEQGWWE
jgi:hypothetical protein